MKPTIAIVVILLSVAVNGQDNDVVAEEAVPQKTGTGYSFTEGPAVALDDSVYFTDQSNDRIYRWVEQEGITLWLEGTGRSNGLYFNPDNKLVACADEQNRIIFIDNNKEMKVLHEEFALAVKSGISSLSLPAPLSSP